jgi:hypothetical protein
MLAESERLGGIDVPVTENGLPNEACFAAFSDDSVSQRH